MITMTHASVLGSSNELVTGCTPIYLKDYSYSLWCVQLMIGSGRVEVGVLLDRQLTGMLMSNISIINMSNEQKMGVSY